MKDEDKIVCKACSLSYEKLDGKLEHVCPSCKYNPTYFQIDVDIYSSTSSHVSPHPPTITVGEPCMVNPSSIKAVRSVLQHVVDNTIRDGREWTLVHSDGVPYTFADDLQDKIFVCNVCSEEVKKENVDEHKLLHEEEEVTFRHLFEEILLRPGPGHYEMTMAKCLLNFGWQPIIRKIAIKLGFRTPKAQNVVKSGIDHHRSQQILAALLNALSRELIIPYVRYCITHNVTPTLRLLTCYHSIFIQKQ